MIAKPFIPWLFSFPLGGVGIAGTGSEDASGATFVAASTRQHMGVTASTRQHMSVAASTRQHMGVEASTR